MRFGAVVLAGLMVAAVGAQAQQVQQAKPPVVVEPVPLSSAQQAAPRVPGVTIGPTTKTSPGLQAWLQSHGKVNPRFVLLSPACPGTLQAQQQSTGGATIWTTALGDQNARLARARGLGIHVDFHATKTLKSVELRVSFLPLGLHQMEVTPAFTNTRVTAPQERTKTFTLDREAAIEIAADLLVGPAATITRVHLVSATFADGTVWRAPSADACTVVPSRMMQVARR